MNWSMPDREKKKKQKTGCIMSEEASPWKPSLFFGKIKVRVLEEPAHSQLGLGWSHRDPLYNVYKRNSVCQLPAELLPRDLITIMVWQQPSQPSWVRISGWGPGTRDPNEPPWWITHTPKYRTLWALHSWSTNMEEWIQISSPSLGSRGTGIPTLLSAPGPHVPSWHSSAQPRLVLLKEVPL